MSEPDAFKISEAVIDLWRCYIIERDMAKELEAENARLKSEVERLTAQVSADAIDREHGMCCDSSSEVSRLKAENERLRKAGDAMATNIPRMVTCQVTAHEAVDFINAWNAAKEGRPNE